MISIVASGLYVIQFCAIQGLWSADMVTAAGRQNRFSSTTAVDCLRGPAHCDEHPIFTVRAGQSNV